MLKEVHNARSAGEAPTRPLRRQSVRLPVLRLPQRHRREPAQTLPRRAQSALPAQETRRRTQRRLPPGGRRSLDTGLYHRAGVFFDIGGLYHWHTGGVYDDHCDSIVRRRVNFSGCRHWTQLILLLLLCMQSCSPTFWPHVGSGAVRIGPTPFPDQT